MDSRNYYVIQISGEILGAGQGQGLIGVQNGGNFCQKFTISERQLRT